MQRAAPILLARILLAALLALAPAPAVALSRDQALMILRTLSMLQPRPQSPITVYLGDPDPSRTQTLAAVGLQVVAESGYGGAVGVLLPEEPQAGAFAERALTAGKVTIGLDPSCLESALCVLYLATSPETEIIISRAALERAGVRFNQAFLYMAKQR